MKSYSTATSLLVIGDFKPAYLMKYFLIASLLQQFLLDTNAFNLPFNPFQNFETYILGQIIEYSERTKKAGESQRFATTYRI